jgi:hypothetical protein
MCKSHHKQQQNERIMEVTMAKIRTLMRIALLDNLTASTETPTNNNQSSTPSSLELNIIGDNEFRP